MGSQRVGHNWAINTATTILLTEQKKRKIQGNCMGLKITACKHSWGNFGMQKIQSDQKSQLALLKSLEQNHGVESKSWVLCMPPTHNTTWWVGTPPKSPLGLSPHTPLYGIPYKEDIHPHLGERAARETVVCSCSLLLQQRLQKSRGWISCLASDQFLLIGEGQQSWLVNSLRTFLEQMRLELGAYSREENYSLFIFCFLML